MPVTSLHPLYKKMESDWDIMAEALDGEDAVKANPNRLRKTEGMVEAERVSTENAYIYKSYLHRAEYPHWVKDGLRTMMGLVSRLTPEIVLPERMESMRENATADGFGLVQLFQRTVAASLGYGRNVLLVDVDDNQLPFVAVYGAKDATNWKESLVNGRKDLTLTVLQELKSKSSDEFSHESETVYRVLDLEDGIYRARVVNSAGADVDEEKRPGMYGANGELVRGLDYIPIVFSGSTDNSPDPDEIPLLSMAKSALKYYELSADYYQALHRTAHPQPWVSGLSEDQNLRVTGPSAAWALPQDAQCGYLEITGNGIEKIKSAMDTQRSSALESGAKVMDVGGIESGDARRARQDDQQATLHAVVMTAAEAVEQCLRFAAQFMDIDPDEVKFAVKPDFVVADVDPQMAAQLLQAVMAGKVSNESYWTYIGTGKLPERSWEDEFLMIDNAGGI